MAPLKTTPSVADREASPELGVERDRAANSWNDLIEADPNRPGPDRVVLKDTGIPVWAIVGYLQTLTGKDIDASVASEAVRRTAADYATDERLIWAAVAYYLDHRHAIDGKLARNAAAIA